MDRHEIKVFDGLATSDGAGVKLNRVIGQPDLMMIDPFLLFDAFSSNNPNDYMAGFPSHPHRGFETVSYMLKGKMHHKDNAGHEGIIDAGGVQWMTAGKGIIHSEMPEQDNGVLHGFQLWINLPASHKMVNPCYQEFSVDTIPSEIRQGAIVKVIAGTTSLKTKGPVSQEYTKPIYLDVSLDKEEKFIEPLPVENNSFIYLIKGDINILNKAEDIPLSEGKIAILFGADSIKVRANKNSQFLLISGKPIINPPT